MHADIQENPRTDEPNPKPAPEPNVRETEGHPVPSPGPLKNEPTPERAAEEKRRMEERARETR